LANPGDAFPDGVDWIPRALKGLQRQIDANASSRSLAASQIGAGGVLISGGGSLTIEGTGSLNVGSGALNSAGSISAGTTITASGTVQGNSLRSTGNSQIDGSETVNGNIAVGGSVTASGGVRGTDLYSSNAAGYNITGTRAGGWWETATGRAGTAVSSRHFKTHITDAKLRERAPVILELSIKHYQYLAQLAKRDDPNSPDNVGPWYKVHTEVGLIAEDLHAAGLWEFVIYEREFAEIPWAEDDRPQSEEEFVSVLVERLVLDNDGEPIPRSIHYEMFALAGLAATQFVWSEVVKERQRANSFAARLHALDGLEEDSSLV